jgi:3-deoxy-D-manno-octulosonate 8-phosphate phosphatase (KDO 8-P phosphatase)
LQKNKTLNILEKFREITTFIFDVDGVLTDGSLVVTEAGELLRTMNAKDGYAMRRAVEMGYRICIITGGRSKGVEMRFRVLGLDDIYSGITNKIETYHEYIDKNNIDADHILYMGDDMPDYHVMRLVGLPTCPADAIPEIVGISLYVSPFGGGKGCVRDVIEKVLKLQGNWEL